VNIESATNITFKNNSVASIMPRPFVNVDGALDLRCGVCVCAFVNGNICKNLTITNNLVAGAYYTGFAAPAHKCDDFTDKIFMDNQAHSVEGEGAIVFPNPANID